jgi:hypothetical protein
MAIQSSLIGFLVSKLIPQSGLIPHQRIISRMRDMTEKRNFFKRLRKAVNGQIPHPIFSKKFLNLALFGQIWRAKLISTMLPNMHNGECIPVSPSNIKWLLHMFDMLFQKGESFAMQFYDGNDCTVVMKFDSPSNNEGGTKKRKLALYGFNEEQVCSTTLGVTVEKTPSNNCGIQLNVDGVIFYHKIRLFYTKLVNIPIYPFNSDQFIADKVKFYTISGPFSGSVKRKRVKIAHIA